MNPARPIRLAGATASGKSAVALLLAKQWRGEIISVDSMQVYCGLDIGTAKPTAEERRRVPHHLIDIVGLDEQFDAARFVELASVAEKEIVARGKTPVFCGGTGLYFKAQLHGLGDAPPSDAALRAKLQTLPLEQLLAELQVADAATFAAIDRQNPRRIIRAVEVIRLTGKPFSQQRSNWKPSEESSNPETPATSPPAAPRLICLKRTSGDLHRRIEKRVRQMFADGLVEETRTLLGRGLEANPTAMQSIGYRQVVEHLQGARGLEETIELVIIRTRQFAKRQMTWFRRQLPADWIHCEEDESTESIAARVAQIWMS